MLSANCKDLLKRLLQRNPKDRISFEQFFNHPFIDLDHMPSSNSFPKAVCFIYFSKFYWSHELIDVFKSEFYHLERFIRQSDESRWKKRLFFCTKMLSKRVRTSNTSNSMQDFFLICQFLHLSWSNYRRERS